MKQIAARLDAPDHQLLSVQPYDGDDGAWDDFAAGDPGSNFCHLAAWRDIMDAVLGHECRYAVAHDQDDDWQGVLPLVRVRSRLFGHYLLSMPFLSYGGPLGSPEARQALTSHARREAERLGVGLLELRNRRSPGLEEAQKAVNQPSLESRLRDSAPLRVSDRKVTVTLPLPDTVEELWNETFRAKLRSQIRRPQKEGLVARFGATDQVDPFYEVFARHMRDLGTPVLPRRFFERIARALPQALFCTVWSGDQPIAAGCGFLWNGEFEITWAASLREHNRSAPNMLLYYAYMERMIDDGAEVFNFGRCSPGSGTHRFKLQWGAKDEPLPWAQWSPRGVTATPSPERPLFQLATAAWQRLPLTVANRLGPHLARRLP